MAVRYTGRHVRQARHGAWVNKKRSRSRRPPTRLLPAAAAFTVAGFLVGGASAAIGLNPPSNPSGHPAYDPADIPPPDLNAAAESGADLNAAAESGADLNATAESGADLNATADGEAITADRAPLVSSGVAGGSLAAAVIETGSCEVSYNDRDHLTASGEAFDPTAFTAAHTSLPFGTLVRVVNPGNGQSVVVRINDRGPDYGDRCLDLTAGAFASIADPSVGVVDVRYEVLAQDAT